MSDVFDEIADDLRREKLNLFWKENGSWIIGGVVLAILMTGALSFWRDFEFKRNAAATAELTRVATMNDAGALEYFAQSAPADQAMLARFMSAGSYAQKGEKDKALAMYNAIVETRGVDKAYRNLAKLYAVSLRADGGDAVTLRAELAPLVSDKSPWRYTALELDALLALRAGDRGTAVENLTKITADPLAPADARARAFTLRWLYVAEASK
jgi:hypothetical protein